MSDVPANPSGTWLAIGTWDGVHAGHQAIISTLVQRASQVGGQSIVMSFDPHPRTVVRPQCAPLLLQTLEERTNVLGALGVDFHLILNFTREFAQLSPEDFVEGLIATQLRPAAVMVGFNFTYGKCGRGNAMSLMAHCRRLGIPVEVFEPVCMFGETVSSTAIRNACARGDLPRAAVMLGRPHRLSLEVLRIQRAEEFMSVTARAERSLQLPPPGWFDVQIRGTSGTLFIAAHNGPAELVLPAHLRPSPGQRLAVDLLMRRSVDRPA